MRHSNVPALWLLAPPQAGLVSGALLLFPVAAPASTRLHEPSITLGEEAGRLP